MSNVPGSTDVVAERRQRRRRHGGWRLADQRLCRARQFERARKVFGVGVDAREGRTRRGDLQPDRRILRNLDRLERLLPGLCRLVMQVEAPRRFLRVRPDPAELLADARFGVFRQRNVTAENMQDRRFAPVVGVAEIQVDRPVLASASGAIRPLPWPVPRRRRECGR